MALSIQFFIPDSLTILGESICIISENILHSYHLFPKHYPILDTIWKLHCLMSPPMPKHLLIRVNYNISCVKWLDVPQLSLSEKSSSTRLLEHLKCFVKTTNDDDPRYAVLFRIQFVTCPLPRQLFSKALLSLNLCAFLKVRGIPYFSHTWSRFAYFNLLRFFMGDNDKFWTGK
jgi:hypothetical protein